MDKHRVRLTKRILKEALIEELQKKTLPQVTVKMLCDKAGINRSTFYSHYEDLRGLLHEIETDIISAMPLISYSNATTLDEVIEHADYIEQNYDAITVLIKNGFFVQAAILKFVNDYTNKNLPNQKEKENNTALFQFVAAYTIGGMSQSLLYWSENKKVLSSQQIALLLLDLSKSSMGIRKKHENMHNV